MISTPPDIYTDLQGLSRLRNLTRRDSAKALDAVARQFEALFMQMMLKSVRDSSFGDPLFDSQQLDFYREMHDSQLAIEMADKGGIGIAEMLVKQLGKGDRPGGVMDGQPVSYPVPQRLPFRAVVKPEPSGRMESAAAVAPAQDPVKFDSPVEFVEHLWPQARQAAGRLGVSPELLLAQAALETGWGKKIIQQAPGVSSHNLFNIKADRRWKGERTGVDTLEYLDGQMVRQRAAFRVYDSFADSFADYVQFLRSNPRYGEALQHRGDDRGFVRALHRAGYATDPEYADKILRILEGPILTAAVERVKFSAAGPIDSYEVALAGDDE